MKRALEASLILALAGASSASAAEVSGAAVYEIGTAGTDVGDDGGSSGLAYGLGARGSVSFPAGEGLWISAGADALIRGFGVDIPQRAKEGAGVFDQNELLLDEWIGVRLGKMFAGLYVEQRRIDRSTSLGVIGSPALGVGLMVEPRFDADGRMSARLSYAQFLGGHLRLEGSAAEPELKSGRALRLSLRRRFTARWGAEAEYGNVHLALEDVPPTFTFFDHSQTTLSVGAFVSF